jgi:hypothetical protein
MNSPTELPHIARVRQVIDQPELHDPAHTLRDAMLASRLTSRLRPGARVAVTVGSRGIVGIDRLARSAVETLKGLGFEPFVVAAMGSHGGGTPAGQAALLAEVGVTSSNMGCPISTSMDTVVLGDNSFGLPIHVDAAAAAADGIVLLNRVKPHTSFHGQYESGLLKMLAIGLGKRQGASQVHKLGLPGLVRLVPEVGAFLLVRLPVVLGLGILENARERTARIVAIEPEDLLEREPLVLEEARGLLGRLPFDQIDVLIVAELGKNFSGTGMDPNVIGRQRVEAMPDLSRPSITRLAVLDVSPESRGNALGVGLADLITSRVKRDLDLEPMKVNALTANFLTRIRIPLDFPNDRDVLAVCLDTCWRATWPEARMVLVPNTLELETLYVTRALESQACSTPNLELESSFRPIPFCCDDPDRIDLPLLFPESALGRRVRCNGPDPVHETRPQSTRFSAVSKS